MANNLITPDLNFFQNKTNVCYVLSNVAVEELASELNSTSWSGTLNNLFSDLSSYIASLRVYPINFMTLFSADPSTDIRLIHIGKSTLNNTSGGYIPGTGSTALFIPQAFLKVEMCQFTINANNFSDFMPYTSYELYLPYYGTYTISDNALLNKVIKVYYTIDILTGKLAIDLVYVDEQNQENAYIRLNSTIGLDLPIISNNQGSLLKKLGSDFFNGINSIATNPTPLNYMENVYKQLADIKAVGNIKGNYGSEYLMWYLPQHPILFKRKIKITNFDKSTGYFNDEYLHLKGQASEKIVNIEDLNGYAKVKEIHLENFTKASKNEIEEIERLLKDGVII